MTSFYNHSAPLRFDLNRGRISNRDGDGFVLVPLAVMSELCRELSEDSLTSFGYAMGTEVGRRLQQRLSGSAGDSGASLNDVVGAMGDELATAGLGTLGVEIWGNALVFTLQEAVLSFGGDGTGLDRADSLIAALLSGVLMRAFSRDSNVVALGRSGRTARFVACSPGTSEHVERWVAERLSAAEVLARLNQGVQS
jgi:hypothetical protein